MVLGGASNSKCQASVRGDGGQTRRADLTDEVTKLAANRATTSAPSDDAGLIIRRLRHSPNEQEGVFSDSNDVEALVKR